MFIALLGAFLISLLVLASQKLVDLTEPQQKALRQIHLTRSSATTI